MPSVTHLTKLLDTVSPALLDTTSLKVNVLTPLQMSLSLLISVVDNGIGRTKNAFPAQRDGLSTTKESVCQSLINVPATIMLDFALHASKDTILRTDSACSPHQTTPSLPIKDAPPGVGTNRNVSHAQRDGSSTRMEFVSLFLTIAEYMPKTETALSASKDTISKKDAASSLLPTTLIPQTWDVELGTGTKTLA